MNDEWRIEGSIVRGLTLWRPWPWCFRDAGKLIENRPWKLPAHLQGCWLALHSGKKFDTDASLRMAAGHFGSQAMKVSLLPWKHPSSVITVLMRVERSVTYAELTGLEQLALGPYAFGPECWIGTETVVLPEPVPCRGSQGLWRLPPGVGPQLSERFAAARRAA